MILITHDLGVVAGMTSRINVMYAGYVVEAATTGDLFATPRHPYTVGLLHSIPRLDAVADEPLIPIEGVPPDLRMPPVGCQFAPRCAWRVARCWTDTPPLDPYEPLPAGETIRTTGPQTTHRIACWNPPTAEEAAHGAPLRPGVEPAPPPDRAAAVTSAEGGTMTAGGRRPPRRREPETGRSSRCRPSSCTSRSRRASSSSTTWAMFAPWTACRWSSHAARRSGWWGNRAAARAPWVGRSCASTDRRPARSRSTGRTSRASRAAGFAPSGGACR